MDQPVPPPPSASWGDEGYTGGVEQPPSIRSAVRLMWVGAAISGLGIIVTLFQRDEIKDEIREADSSLTPSEVDTATAFAITITVVVGLIAIGLWLWMAHTNGQGKSWARIVATVLGGLNILFALLGLAQGQMPALSLIVTLVSIALAATILILLYRPDAGRYYEAMTPR